MHSHFASDGTRFSISSLKLKKVFVKPAGKN